MELNEALCLPKTIHKVTPCKISRQARIDKMVKLIFNGETDFTQISKQIGVSRKQAYTYWSIWLESDEAKQVTAEWWAEYKRLKAEGSPKAFEGITRIKYRMTTEKHELKATLKEIKLEWKLEPNPANPIQTPPETT